MMFNCLTFIAKTIYYSWYIKIKQILSVMEVLSVEKSKKLIWLTWFELVIVGIIVYFCTNPTSAMLLLAGPVALHALINFWIKSEGVPVKLKSGVPSVFLPTAFVTGFGALFIALLSECVYNSSTLALATVCALCVMAIYPEARYVHHNWTNLWHQKSVALLCGGFLLKVFSIHITLHK